MPDTARPPFTVHGAGSRRVGDGWSLACLPPGSAPDAIEPESLRWVPARVPGTVAASLAGAGAFVPPGLDDSEWWFRTSLDLAPTAPGERLVLCFEGIATLWEVRIDGEAAASGESMFRREEIDVTDRAGASIDVLIRCRPLADGVQRSRPRPRWRTRVAASALRWHRTTLLGRAPGFAAAPAPVGPWREVRLDHRRVFEISWSRVRAVITDGDGEVLVRLRGRWLGVAHSLTIVVDGPSGRSTFDLDETTDGDDFHATGRLVVSRPQRWFPHTHGTPNLYQLSIRVGDHEVDLGRVGFTDIRSGRTADHDLERDGLALHVNDVSVFARGFLWSALDLASLAEDPADLRRTLTLARDAGANMIRVPGTTVYPSAAFYDLCDELGILVWQDLMFANFDYPFDDPEFRAVATEEIEVHVERFASHASLAVLCGGSEVHQQAAMFGVDSTAATIPFLDATVPAMLAELDCAPIYLPSSPWGGALPFRFDRGVAHYFGVGGYRRPLNDVKLAGVKFASECLAFGNVPEPEAFEDILPDGSGDLVVTHPAWKAGVPRDVGSGWDFDDVRDHYLRELYGVDPSALRAIDHARYMSLSRRVSGEVMQEVFGEWRRGESACAGALVLWLRDIVPGAGWGVLDSAGRPKAVYHLVKRLLAPVAVWTTDDGLAGLRVHIANDRPDPLVGVLRVGLYRDAELLIERADVEVEIAPNGRTDRDVEELLGRFVDASGAYAFGPPSHDLVVATLEDDLGVRRSQHLRFLHGHPWVARPNERIRLLAELCSTPGEVLRLRLRSRAAAIGVRVRMAGFTASDDVFDVAPGDGVEIALLARDPHATRGHAEITADNLAGVVTVDCRTPEPPSLPDAS
jgi:beta-mannosidase